MPCRSRRSIRGGARVKRTANHSSDSKQRSRDRELGDRKLGDRELGDRELGDRKLGDRKLGDRKLGDRELGDRKLGDRKLQARVFTATQVSGLQQERIAAFLKDRGCFQWHDRHAGKGSRLFIVLAASPSASKGQLSPSKGSPSRQSKSQKPHGVSICAVAAMNDHTAALPRGARLEMVCWDQPDALRLLLREVIDHCTRAHGIFSLAVELPENADQRRGLEAEARKMRTEQGEPVFHKRLSDEMLAVFVQAPLNDANRFLLGQHVYVASADGDVPTAFEWHAARVTRRLASTNQYAVAFPDGQTAKGLYAHALSGATRLSRDGTKQTAWHLRVSHDRGKGGGGGMRVEHSHRQHSHRQQRHKRQTQTQSRE